jgi:DNA-binding response OmpR family regulator
MENTNSKLLIVDDEEAILFAFSKVLKGPHLEIETASTLDTALDLLGREKYRVVIADLKLSGMSNNEGFEVIKTARTGQKNCTIIVMTAYGDEKTKEKAGSLGVDFYLEKPVSPQKVRDILVSLGLS